MSSENLTPSFKTTRWSVVLTAGNEDPNEARHALEHLTATYWYPLYAYLRRRGNSHDDAQDWTQGFFAHLLEKRDAFKRDEYRGRFRAFLLTSLKNYVANDIAKEQTIKRGGGQVRNIDPEEAQRLFDSESRISSVRSPEEEYERTWARALLQKVLHGLFEPLEEGDRPELFRDLKEQLVGGSRPIADIAEKHGMTETAVKVTLHRLRRRFAQLLRQEIRDTVASNADVEEELRHLLDVLA